MKSSTKNTAKKVNKPEEGLTVYHNPNSWIIPLKEHQRLTRRD
jgi:hypothetical protein